MKKSIFSKIITPMLHKFQPLHGVATWLPTFAVPQKGWSYTSFITPESCIALVYSEQYGKGPKPKFRATFGRLPIRPNIFLAFRIPWFSIPSLFQIDFSNGSE